MSDDPTVRPQTWRHVFPWPDPEQGPYMLVVEMLPIDGRMECVELRIIGFETSPDFRRFEPDDGKPHPINRTLLRDIELGRIVEMATAQTRAYLAYFKSDLKPSPGFQRALDAAPVRGGRKPQPDEHYVTVAGIYRAALMRRANPTRTVANELSMSYSTASKHVAEARRRGLLPPTEKGTAKA